MGGWSAPRPGRFTPGKDPVPIVQEAGWAPGPVWTGVENLAPTGIRSPDRPARSESLYRLSYPGPLFFFARTIFMFPTIAIINTDYVHKHLTMVGLYKAHRCLICDATPELLTLFKQAVPNKGCTTLWSGDEKAILAVHGK